MKKTIKVIVDARSLQDEAFSQRGIGQCGSSILRHARATSDCDFVLKAITDNKLPKMQKMHSSLFDAVHSNADFEIDRDTWFIELSPMTHSPLHIAKCLIRNVGRRATIVYDFIPLEMQSRYLSKDSNKLLYDACLFWLQHYDLYLSDSHHVAQRTTEVLGRKNLDIKTVGVPVRSTLLPSSQVTSELSKHIIVVAGEDPRKNVEIAIVAHARSSFLKVQQSKIIIVGSYTEHTKDRLLRLHNSEGGIPDSIEILSNLEDSELGALYRNATVAVCPSRNEGFSMPVVEANANFCPVLVSDCEAHRELVPFTEDRFNPDDTNWLQTKLEEIFTSNILRDEIISRQKGIWARFTEEKCSNRFWSALREKHEEGERSNWNSFVNRKRKPRLAFVGPVPPARSGVSDYTRASILEIAKKADVHIFTDTNFAKPDICYESINEISIYPYISNRFDAVISVIGNSELHKKPFEMLLDYGGASIAHDARMLDFYAWVYSRETAADLASKELGKTVSVDDIDIWLREPNKLPILFLSEIINASRPAFLHSKVTEKLITNLYGIQSDVQTLPFCGYRQFLHPPWEANLKVAARQRLGINEREFLLVSFGNVSFDRAPQECIWAIVILKQWGIRVNLAFAGLAEKSVASSLRAQSEEWGVGDQVKIFERYLTESEYLDFLSAADAGIQLRTYKLGGLSGALSDCIEAAIPTVATFSLAESMEAPDFVRVVPDELSAVLIAEQIAYLVDSAWDPRPIEAAKSFKHTHNFDVYAKKLLEALGFQP